MLKRTIALVTLLSVLLTGTALGSEYYSARTPLNGAGGAKLNNINLAIDAINGVEVPYDASFSFNGAVGPRTKSRGYQKAPNGRGVNVTGGGVAQVATTLYLALLQVRGDIEIDPVKTYGASFTDNYVTDSGKAVIADYDADIDLSFTNNEDDMTIEMWASDSYVYCSITVGGEDEDGWSSSGGTRGFWADTSAPDAQTGAAKSGGGRSGSDGDEEDDADDESDDWFFSAEEDEPERELIATACLDCGGEEAVLHNVALAAECVNDTVLNHRDIFSFNDVVGPRTGKYGYETATNGRGAMVTGGGVAQVASVIWLAIKDMDGISIIEKATYGSKYNQHYVDRSSDAILIDYKSDRDFSFRYTGDGSITLYTYVDDGWLYCDIYED